MFFVHAFSSFFFNATVQRFVSIQALEKSGLNDVDRNVEVVVVNHPSPASPTGIKWQKATHLNELVLASSKGKEIDRFLR